MSEASGRVICALLAIVAGCSGSSGAKPDAGQPSDAAEAGPDAPSDASAVLSEQLCGQVCQVVLQVPCPGEPFQDMDTCVAMCVAVTKCVPQTATYDACIVTGGANILTCNTLENLVVVQSGYCTQEIDDLTNCLGI